MRSMNILLPALFILLGCIPSHPRQGIVKPVPQKPVQTKTVQATTETSSQDIIEYEGFTVSYNSQWRIPNWVAYELTAEETDGPYSRKGKDFMADPATSVLQADAYDYKGSGWSRGHMAPAADFKWSDKAMTESFYYTNICPQDVQLNNRYWTTLENKVRSWARQFGRVYVVTGPIVANNSTNRIGVHGVMVPDAFFKAILAPKEDGWTSIAFVMLNTPEPRQLKDCATTVNEVEKVTNLDLFGFLDDSLEETVENILDYKEWRVY